MVYSFPPNPADYLEKGLKLFAELWTPILDVFQAEGVKFALEVHPTEIAFDIASAENALNAVKRASGLRLQLRPQPLRLPGRGLCGVHSQVRRAASSTCT